MHPHCRADHALGYPVEALRGLSALCGHSCLASGTSPHEVKMTNPDKQSKRKKTKSQALPAALPVIQSMVAGIDVGSMQHWVCGPTRADGAPNVRVFGTTTIQ